MAVKYGQSANAVMTLHLMTKLEAVTVLKMFGAGAMMIIVRTQFVLRGMIRWTNWQRGSLSANLRIAEINVKINH